MKKTKILLVEDEPALGHIVRDTLVSRGYDVMLEATGPDGLEQAKNGNPDLILLDVMLPTMDGYEVAEEIRKMNIQTPIVFLTAKTATEDVVRGFHAGGNDFLKKPFALEELIVRIENLVRGNTVAPAEKSHELTLGDFRLQSQSQTLTHVPTGEVRKLSHRENELLKMLHANRDDMLKRREVLITLWKDDSYFNSRNLDVYISKLRSYLKSDPKVEILTLKGHGYRLVLP